MSEQEEFALIFFFTWPILFAVVLFVVAPVVIVLGGFTWVTLLFGYVMIFNPYLIVQVTQVAIENLYEWSINLYEFFVT